MPDPSFPQPRALALIVRGNPLWNMIKTSVAFEYALPDGLSDDEEAQIVEFLDLVKDYCDIALDIDSVRGSRDAEKALESYVGELAERGFLVGASLRRMLLIDGPGQAGTPWPILRVEVQPASLAAIADERGRAYFGEQRVQD